MSDAIYPLPSRGGIEIFTTVVIPGAICVAAGSPILLEQWNEYAEKYAIETPLFYAVLGGMIIFIGYLVDAAGSYVEGYCLEPRDETKRNNIDTVWKKYLMLCFPNEPVGQRYLRRVVGRMKFSLNAGVALIISSATATGCFFFSNCSQIWVAWAIVSFVVGGLLMVDAKTASAMLHELRSDLVVAFGSPVEALPRSACGDTAGAPSPTQSD